MTNPNDRPARFVVLEHRWNGVHWDFMLEAGSSLRTWALDSLPEPGIEIEARALPNHRLAYLDYEGPISGDRGRVRRVEAGTYEPIVLGPDRVVARLRGDQVTGDAELVRLGRDDRCGWRLRIGKFI